MVRPISIDHAYFRKGRISAFGTEIVAAEGQVGLIHGQTVPGKEIGKILILHITKTRKDGYVARNLVVFFQCSEGFERSFPRFYGINQVVFDCLDVLRRKGAVKQVDTSRADHGPMLL